MGFRSLGMLALLAGLVVGEGRSWAQERNERPCLLVQVASLNRLHTGVDHLLAAAQRPELSDLLAERLQSTGDLPGIDRERPSGWMWCWRPDDPLTEGHEPPAVIVYLPFTERQAFLKTIALDSVSYRFVTDDHAELDRPDAPYHVVFRDGYAWLGDDPAELARLGRRHTELLRDRPLDSVLWCVVDARQIPFATRQNWGQLAVSQLSTWLQQRDSEAAADHELRRPWGLWLREVISEASRQTSRVTLAVTSSAESEGLRCRLRVEPDTESDWARRLRQWPRVPTPLSRLAETEAAITVAAQGPSTMPAGRPRWELGAAVFGHPFEQRVAIAVVRDPAIGSYLDQLPVADDVTKPLGSGRLERRSLAVLPAWLRRYTGGDPEVWLGSADGWHWLGFGPPEAAYDRLVAVHERLTAERTERDVPLGVRLRMSPRDVIPWLLFLQPGWADQQVQSLSDHVELDMESTAQGLSVQADLPPSLLRLVGAALAEDLSTQLDQLLFDERE